MLDILVVDDDEMARGPIAEALSNAGHRVVQAEDGASAISLLEARGYDLVVSDVRMPRLDGLTLLRRVKRESPGTEFLVMTSHPLVPDAVGSLRDGATDYVVKPFDPDDFVRDVVGPIDERRSLRKKFDRARTDLASRDAGAEIVGMSRVMRELSRRLAIVAAGDCSVLLSGEAGTGKKLLARTLHARSPRREGPFVVVPCAALPELMLESELEQLRDGMTEPRRDAWFRAAEGGTLVLDGVDGLPIPAQANLLRVFQEPGARASRDHEWESRGVRVVATATRDLAELAASGAFLQPLIFRLNTVHFHVPRVVEREGDLYLLAVHFLREMAPPSSVARRSLSPRAWRALSQYRFPGNVAELEAALQTGLSLADGGEIDLEHLPPAIREMQDRGD